MKKDSKIEKLAQELKHLETQRNQLQKRQKDEEQKIRAHRLTAIGAAVESVLGRCIELKEIPKLIALFINKRRMESFSYFVINNSYKITDEPTHLVHKNGDKFIGLTL